MSLRSFSQNRWGKALLWPLFWTLLGLSFAGQFYISSAKAGNEVSWRQAINWSLGDWYVFALLSLPVMQVARRFRFEAGNWFPSFFIHLFCSGLFSLGYIVLLAWVGQ